MKYVFDIDNTICKTDNSDYANSRPWADRIAEINELFYQGNEIIYFTARGMGRTNNNVLEAHKMFYDVTRRQLDAWGARYTSLMLGKPAADIYIDDKGCNDDKFFSGGV